jgi:hypothetical protein
MGLNPKFVLWAGVGAGSILLVATGLLAYLNWGQKVWPPIAGIFLGGTVTVFLTILSLLSGETISRAFTTSVVIDMKEGLAAFVTEGSDSPTTRRVRDLGHLGRPVVQDAKGTGTRLVVEPARTNDQMFQFSGELIQYYIFRSLEALRGGSMVAQIGQTVSAAVTRPPVLSRQVDLSGEVLSKAAAVNRFSKSAMETFSLTNGRLPVPEDTAIALTHVASSPATGREQFVVTLKKPNFFELAWVIRPLGMTGPGGLPAGVVVNGKREDFQTVQFEVVGTAQFERWTSGNWQTDELKKWATWLLDAVATKVADQ